MSEKAESRFVYVTYIRTTQERLWDALTNADFMRKYWLTARPEAEWKVGGAWKITLDDGRIADTGEIVAFDPPTRLAIRWLHEKNPDLKSEGYSLCTMDLEPAGDTVKLTVVHAMDRADSKLIEAVSGGWPKILSNLKTLVETGSITAPASA